jgi:hypothetical protein
MMKILLSKRKLLNQLLKKSPQNLKRLNPNRLKR